MNWPEIESWFKNTLSGIIILGAAGSILSVWLGKLVWPAVVTLFRLPARLHSARRTFQAYLLGFSFARIGRDTTGRDLVLFVTYHLARLVVLLVLALAAWITFLLLILLGSRQLLTVASYLSIVVLFLSLYGAYFELEYLYRIFLSFWKAPLANARESYLKWRDAGYPSSDKTGGPDVPSSF